MTATNQADRSLILAARRLTTTRSTQRLIIRWADDPQLHGRTPAEMLDVLAHRGHDDHDCIVRGLAIQSQGHDEDATVLLVVALRPGFWKLAHTYHRARLSGAFDDLVVNAVHVISRVDPTSDLLYDRILGRIRAATPRASQWPKEEPLAELDDTPIESDSDMIDQIEACDALRRLGQLRQADTAHTADWNDLMEVRVRGTYARDIARGRTPSQVRADISRFSRRIERLLAA